MATAVVGTVDVGEGGAEGASSTCVRRAVGVVGTLVRFLGSR